MGFHNSKAKEAADQDSAYQLPSLEQSNLGSCRNALMERE